MKYAGIDLHSNNCMVSVIDERDRVLAERRVGNQLEAVLAVLEPHREELVGVVVESTFNWYWLVDGLQGAGYEVRLANTAALPQYNGLKYVDDRSDARHLAHLLRLGIVPTGFIYPKEARAVRDLARSRMRLVQARTRVIISIENKLACETGSCVSANQVKRLGAQELAALALHADVSLAITAQRAVIATLDEQIAALEKRLQERVGLQCAYRTLLTVPGIGAVLATVIALETGPIERFAAVGDYASYARCVDSTHLSNGKKKGAGNVKNGNRYLAWAFVEAAQYCRRYCAPAARFYERKRAKTNTALATKALAHKLARACYHMLKQGTPFDRARCFG
jgi:transposase